MDECVVYFQNQLNGGYRNRPSRPYSFMFVFVIVIVIVISKLLKRYSKAKRIRAPAYSRALRRIKGGFPKGVKRSSGPNSRVPGGDRVAVRVGVVEMGRGNDQKGQGRRD